MDNSNRIVSIDFLKTFVIIISIFDHFSYKSNLDILKYVHPTINILFGVGAVFVFASGILMYKIYLPKFKQSPKIYSIKLIKKGVMLLFVYLFFVNILRLIHGYEIPLDLLGFILEHPFFTKILFTFSIIFLLTPLFLLFISKLKNYHILLLVATVILFFTHITLKYIPLPEAVATLFFDKREFIYPLFPMLSVYFVGIYIGRYFSKIKNNIYSLLIGFIIFLFFPALIYILNKFNIELFIYKIVWEIILIVIVTIIAEYFLNKLLRNEKLNIFIQDKILIIGKRSLLTFVGANFLIGLTPNLEHYSTITQASVLIIILVVVYFSCLVYKNINQYYRFCLVKIGLLK